jgi:hypothetical protein
MDCKASRLGWEVRCAPARDALGAVELEQPRERVVQVLLIPVAEPRHVLPQLHGSACAHA